MRTLCTSMRNGLRLHFRTANPWNPCGSTRRGSTQLRLEAGHQDTFLETRLKLENNRFQHWLKNDNEDGNGKVWRYQHFTSFSPFLQKRATLTACLKKVNNMACNDTVLYASAMDKLKEFHNLGYPRPLLKTACAYVAAATNNRRWLDVRDDI